MAVKTYPLDQSPLYKLSSRKRLAALLGFDLHILEALAARPANFHEFDIQQGEKKRHVEMPKRALERVHRRLFKLIERVQKPDYLHSGTKGRSYISNAKVHVGAVPVVKLDLKTFYPSVKADRVYRFFTETMKCSPDAAALLTKLCTIHGHVPTGSCLSQLLAYFATKPLFDALHLAAAAVGIRFTCYVDDMTWSGVGATPSFLWQMKQLVDRHGFNYHADKAYTASEAKVVTGVVLLGDTVKVQHGKEHDQWLEFQALGSEHGEVRVKALERLIGKAVASAQIDPRFALRLTALRARKKRAEAELAMA